jgi:hypothetical protein
MTAQILEAPKEEESLSPHHRRGVGKERRERRSRRGSRRKQIHLTPSPSLALVVIGK